MPECIEVLSSFHCIYLKLVRDIMVHLILKQQHRGATTKLMISIFKTHHQVMDVKTEHINLYDLLEVILDFKDVNNYDVMPVLQMRKKENAHNDAVHVKVTGTNFNEQFFCSDGLIEVKMKPNPYNKSEDSDYTYNTKIRTYSYYMEVNITVTEIMPAVPLLANKKLYEDTDFTDFELQGDDGNVPVHKTMLLPSSDVFKAMVRGEWSEKKEGHIKMDGVTVQTLKDLKAYMYLGVLPDEGLQLLLVVAARYMMEKLKADCIAKLVDTMHPESFDEIVNLACQNQIPELVKALVVRIPDDVLNNVYQSKTQGKENDDGKK